MWADGKAEYLLGHVFREREVACFPTGIPVGAGEMRWDGVVNLTRDLVLGKELAERVPSSGANDKQVPDRIHTLGSHR